jgi:glyoxalase superfamily protein
MPPATYKDLCLDAADAKVLGGFWAAALELEAQPSGADPNGDYVLRGPTPQHTIWVNRVPEPKAVKHRVHPDLNTESVERLVELGARVLDADSFSWVVMADPEGGEFCAFVREGQVTRRLYELAVDAGDSTEACHRIAAWWAGVLGATLVDDESGYSYVERIAGAPFEAMTFAPVPEPKAVKNRIHVDVNTTDLDTLVAAGATVLRPQDDEIAWTVLADPDGNEFCAFVVV